MKRVILILGVTLLVSASLSSAREQTRLIDGPGSVITDSYHVSSNTAVSVADGAEVEISTHIGGLSHISVNTAGATSGFDVFDGQISTTNAGVIKICGCDSTSKATHWFKVGIASGIVVRNWGETPADITIYYREKGYHGDHVK